MSEQISLFVLGWFFFREAVASLAAPSHKLNFCHWLLPCLLYPFLGLLPLWPTLQLVVFVCAVLVLRARADVSPNWWMRSVISDANAISNGVPLGACLKLSLCISGG